MRVSEHIINVLNTNVNALSSAFKTRKRHSNEKGNSLPIDNVLDEYCQGIDLQQPQVIITKSKENHIELYI